MALGGGKVTFFSLSQPSKTLNAFCAASVIQFYSYWHDITSTIYWTIQFSKNISKNGRPNPPTQQSSKREQPQAPGQAILRDTIMGLT